MSFSVQLPDELARRVEAVAADRQVSPEEVALEAIEAQLPRRRRLSFSGVGSSGATGRDLARRHRELRAESSSLKSARDA